MKWKNKECNLYGCEDRKELAMKQDQYEKLKEDYDNLTNKLEDFKKIMKGLKAYEKKDKKELEKLFVPKERVQHLIDENVDLRNEATTLKVETERQKGTLRDRNYEIEKLKEQIQEVEEREVKDVYAYRNLEERKITLSKDVQNLEDNKNKLIVDNKVIKQFYNETLPKARKLVEDIKLMEAEEKEIKKRLRKYQKLDKRKISLGSLRAKLLLKKITKAKKQIEKNKKDKAKKTLKKARDKLSTAVLPDNEKKLLRIVLCEQEGRLK